MKKSAIWYFDDATDRGNWDDTTGAQDGDLAVQVDTQVLYVWDDHPDALAWVEPPGGPVTITQAFSTSDNGYGSTNTRIRRFTTQTSSINATWTSSSTLGDYLTIETAGWYVIDYTLSRGAAGALETAFSICVDTALNNTWSLNDAQTQATQTIEDNGMGSMRATLELAVNDLVWFMCEDVSINNWSSIYGTQVRVTRIG